MFALLALFLVHLVPDAAGIVYKQPQLAVSQKMVAATFGAGNAVYFSASLSQGRTFSKPVKVAESGVLALGMHRGPRVAITPSAIVISAVVGAKGGGADGDLMAWRSTDGGKTWSDGVVINDVPAAAREGLHGMASGGKGILFAAWLDLRSKGTKLFGSSSSDGGATWSKNVLVYQSPDGTICQCCHPSVAIDATGKIYVMWRNALGGSRDLYITKSADGGRTFEEAEKLGAGTWPLKACPMDGGGLAIGRDGKVVSAWRRANEVFVAPVGASETRIDTGKNPAIAIGRDGVYVAWSSPAGVQARVPGKADPIVLDYEGSFPQLAAIPNGPVIATWETKGSINFQTLR